MFKKTITFGNCLILLTVILLLGIINVSLSESSSITVSETKWNELIGGGEITLHSHAGGGGGVWGSISGTLSDQTDLQNALNVKEPTISTSTTDKYWRGDKTWQLTTNWDTAYTHSQNTTTAHGLTIANVSSLGSSISESELSISDNTTWNVSTSTHGFVPKAPNNTTTFLRGDATWAAGAGGGSIITKGTSLVKDPYAVSSTVTQAHGLAVQPAWVNLQLTCKTADNGYSVGDIININGVQDTGASMGFIVLTDATNITLITGAATPRILNKGTRAEGSITAANWTITIEVYKYE